MEDALAVRYEEGQNYVLTLFEQGLSVDEVKQRLKK